MVKTKKFLIDLFSLIFFIKKYVIDTDLNQDNSNEYQQHMLLFKADKILAVIWNYEMLDCALIGECAVKWYAGVLELPIPK